MTHVIGRGSGLAFDDRHDAISSQPAEPHKSDSPAAVLEGDPDALAYRPGQGSVQFNLSLNAIAAAQLVAKHYGLSVAALYRLALEKFCEADPLIGDSICEAIRQGNSRIRRLNWTQTRKGPGFPRRHQEANSPSTVSGEG
jgi:hypothetical protein